MAVWMAWVADPRVHLGIVVAMGLVFLTRERPDTSSEITLLVPAQVVRRVPHASAPGPLASGAEAQRAAPAAADEAGSGE